MAAGPGGTRVSRRLRVNPILCEAHGVCAELLPELIGLDPWGYPVLAKEPVPPEWSRWPAAHRRLSALALLSSPSRQPGQALAVAPASPLRLRHHQHRLDHVAVVRGLEGLVDLVERERLDQPVDTGTGPGRSA